MHFLNETKRNKELIEKSNCGLWPVVSLAIIPTLITCILITKHESGFDCVHVSFDYLEYSGQ